MDEKIEAIKKVAEKIDLLKTEKDKEVIEKLIIDIMVDLEKFCHREDVQIHGVLAKTRERCKEEIDK